MKLSKKTRCCSEKVLLHRKMNQQARGCDMMWQHVPTLKNMRWFIPLVVLSLLLLLLFVLPLISIIIVIVILIVISIIIRIYLLLFLLLLHFYVIVFTVS